MPFVWAAFRDFLLEQERWRQKYMASFKEVERLQIELDKSIAMVSDLEANLFRARRWHEDELKKKNKALSESEDWVRIQYTRRA